MPIQIKRTGGGFLSQPNSHLVSPTSAMQLGEENSASTRQATDYRYGLQQNRRAATQGGFRLNNRNPL